MWFALVLSQSEAVKYGAGVILLLFVIALAMQRADSRRNKDQ